MPVVFGVGRGFGFFTATGQQVGNFIRRITYPYSGNHIPSDVFFSSDEKIYITGTGENDTQAYGILTKRDGTGAFYSKEVYNISDTTLDTGYNGIDADSSGNLYAGGFTYTDASTIYPVITKFDANGNILWNRYHSSTSGKIVTNINVSANGNVYICGGDYSGSVAVEGNFVAAYDSSGTCLWNRSITDSSSTYTNFSFVDLKSQSDNSVLVVGYFDGNRKKSIITKYDSSGNLIWNKTLELYGDYNTFINQVHIDSSNQIYLAGETSEIATPYNSRSFVAKLTAEGNLLWQNQSPISTTQYFSNTGVTADDEVGSVYTIGLYKSTPSSNKRLCITKYGENGEQVFRRILRSNIDVVNDINYPSIFATNTDLYISFVDQENNNSICYGRASVSGNGVGDFEYPDGSSVTFFYNVLNVTDVLGTLFDGSVMNLSSDFITYPFSATKLLFDDLAGVYADKRIVSEEAQEITSTTNSTTNAYVSLTDDLIVSDSLLLYYDFKNKASYPGTGTTISNLLGSSYTGTSSGIVYNSGGYFVFDGTSGDYISFGPISLTGAFTLQIYFNTASGTVGFEPFFGNSTTAGAPSKKIGFNSGDFFARIVDGSTSSQFNIGYTTANDNQFNMLTAIRSSSNTIRAALNDNTISNGTTLTGTFTFDRIGQNPDTQYFAGNIGMILIYDRELTQAEVSQNFNATRAKYGV